ncbi:MAG: uncharacterized protein A8A55_2933 [Amphiamblys sp. WSBS2006]|nr:MAG: uncharacterized protein A8A55_2933 [Amphiamblys sp. WSBS2006]
MVESEQPFLVYNTEGEMVCTSTEYTTHTIVETKVFVQKTRSDGGEHLVARIDYVDENGVRILGHQKANFRPGEEPEDFTKPKPTGCTSGVCTQGTLVVTTAIRDDYLETRPTTRPETQTKVYQIQRRVQADLKDPSPVRVRKIVQKMQVLLEEKPRESYVPQQVLRGPGVPERKYRDSGDTPRKEIYETNEW